MQVVRGRIIKWMADVKKKNLFITVENEVCGFWNILNNNPGAKHHIDKRILIGTMQKKILAQ